MNDHEDGEHKKTVKDMNTSPTVYFYEIRGEMVRIDIDEEIATFHYANQTNRSIPLQRLKFCPDCLREKKYPFSEDDSICQRHKTPFLPFDIETFERFQIIALMEDNTR